MALYSITTVRYRGDPDVVLASVEAYLDTIDSTTEVLLAPPFWVGDNNWVTCFIVHKTAP